MAESVVELLLNELSRVLIKEVNLQRGVKQEIEEIKRELETIKAFLRVADAKEKENPMLESWVKQVRDVAFEIEDIVVEFLLLVADGDDANRPHNTCLGSICSSIKKWKAKHQIGSELRSIKGRVNEIAERPKKYGYNPPPDFYEQGSSSATTSTKEIDQVRRNALLVDESQLVGIDATKKELVDWLKHGDPNLKVLAIVGMGGLGKTTLAKQIYNANAVKSHFKRCALVTVSQSLNEDELLKDMVQQLFPGEWTQMQQLPINRLKESIKEKLQNERYFIVLDDVWRTDHWDQVQLSLPRNNCGSRVVITTRITEVAKYSSNEFKGMVHNLQPLSESDSWALFCKKTFPTQRCPSNLEPICREILNKCEGVPLAILAIGGLLATKDEHHVEAWELVQRSLNVELEENPRLQMMNKILSLSFHDLPHHLKPCYMFLSVFPEDYRIQWMSLIRLWIAEGFVAKKNGRTLEEVAESYLYELLNRSLIQIVAMRIDGRVNFCRIHDFLREFVLSKSREQQRFVEVISKDNTAEYIERARRLSIRHYDKIKSSLLSRLRSLFFFEADVSSPYDSSQMSKLPGDGFKLLSVLDLRRAPLITFPEEISTLLLLRYLSLRDTKVSKISKSIRNLKRLETLDLKQTFVTELPFEISMLQKLRHLLIFRYKHELEPRRDAMKTKGGILDNQYFILTVFDVGGFKLTPEIGGLLSLQKLSLLEAPEDSDLIRVLGSLTQLRSLSLVNLTDQHWRELCFSISKMRNLRSLTLHTTGSFDLQYMNSPPPLLQRLRLTGHLDELPSWVCSLKYLQQLHLMFTRLKKDPGGCLGGLPNLTVLVLSYAFDGVKKMHVQPGYFPSLELLIGESDDGAFGGCFSKKGGEDNWKKVKSLFSGSISPELALELSSTAVEYITINHGWLALTVSSTTVEYISVPHDHDLIFL